MGRAPRFPGLGFETLGHATLLCLDGGPVLAADPWLAGSACFGSWGLTHETPPEREEAVLACPFVWVSQDREDHAHTATLERLRGRTILLPDHVGGRTRRRLQAGRVQQAGMGLCRGRLFRARAPKPAIRPQA